MNTMTEDRKETARAATSTSPRILVVEDESDLALLLAYNLERRAMSPNASSVATRPN